MRSTATVVLFVFLLATTSVGSATATRDAPTLDEAYPNPVADGDAGEYVVVSLPATAPSTDYVLTDGETNHSLGNASTGSTVAVANDPRARNLTDHRVLVAPSLSLANAGERLRLVRNGTTVVERRYRDAPDGSVGTWNGTELTWRSLGATDRPVVRGGPGTVEAFVLPDAAGLPVETLRDADDRILLAGYTLTSRRVASALANASDRGVTVRVLLEGEPVGGRTRREATVLDGLADAGVPVRLIGGPRARYDYHHPKYAVVDGRAIVLTENWKPAGTGGNGSRGWGVVTRQPRVVDGLAETFRADAGWRDARPWRSVRQGRQFERGEPAVGSYPTRFEPERVPVNGTTLLVAPDNARPAIVDTIDDANGSVDVVQVSMGEWGGSLPRALRRAAARGVDVRVLLSSAWYVREENRALASRFEDWADERDAPLAARLAEPGERYAKIHAKGAVVDGDEVVLGSLNWNDHAATNNREVVLTLRGNTVAEYYGEVFAADWHGGRPTIPVGVAGAVLGGLAVVGLVGRKLRFDGDTGVAVPGRSD